MGSAALVQVAPFVPVWRALTYRVPEELVPLVRRGCRVVVPLATKRVVGLILEVGDGEEGRAATGLRTISELLDGEPVIGDELLELLLWMARYYMAPLGEAIRAALPAMLHSPEKQRLRITEEGERVLAAQEAVLRSADDDLTPLEQQLLRAVQRASQRSLGLRTLQAMSAGGRGIARLLERGLLAHHVLARAGVNRQRQDLLVELVEPADELSLSRAPQQQALLQALRAAGGRARLSSLAGRPREARVLAQRLAAKGLVRLEAVEMVRDPFTAEPVEEVQRPLVLTAEQEAVLGPLVAASQGRGFQPFLLHGVTGSGKTEVYLQLIAEVLQGGRDALVLVPEISLTPQLAARFRARFGNLVAVLHSGLTDAERYGQWRMIRAGQVRIVVGARSAIFAPLGQLGVVIVDEEHDPSFKQEEGVRYNARDLALVRAQRAAAVAVLGSATPSLESYRRATEGRLSLLEMPHRATPRPLPEVTIVDLRRYQTGPEGFLSAPLAQALAEVLERNEQAILFLNRRGFSTFLLCRSCGHVFRCENCSVTLTYHRSNERLICHYCGYGEAVPRRCPVCAGEEIGRMGLGTEQVEAALRERFPTARVARLDRDTASGLRGILGRVARREIDFLVGTQMVTKGHDFPQVTLVGVITADLGLHFPDFRASERTFQLLTQVAGRAGRGQRSGHVVIQTYSPEHPSIYHAQTHDYGAFFRHELEARRELLYPPWGYLAAVRIDGRDVGAVERIARELAARGRQALEPRLPLSILGPAEAPLQRLKGRTRWMLLLKAASREALRRVLTAMLEEQLERGAPGRVRVSVDVDPLMML